MLYFKQINHIFLFVITLSVFSCSSSSYIDLSDKDLWALSENAKSSRQRIIYLSTIHKKIKNEHIKNSNFRFTSFQAWSYDALLGLPYKKHKDLFHSFAKHTSPTLRDIAVTKIASSNDISNARILVDSFLFDPILKIQFKTLHAIRVYKLTRAQKSVVKLLKKRPIIQLEQKALSTLITIDAKDSCKFLYQQVNTHSTDHARTLLYLNAHVKLNCKYSVNIVNNLIASGYLKKLNSENTDKILELSSTLKSKNINLKLIDYFNTINDFRIIISLIRSGESTALDFIRDNLKSLIHESRYKDFDKMLLTQEILELNNLDLSRKLIDIIISTNNIKLRRLLVWKIHSSMKNNKIRGNLQNYIKYKQFIVDKLITAYHDQPEIIRKELAITIRSFKEYTGKQRLKRLMINEKNAKIKCFLLISFLRIANSTDIPSILIFKKKKYSIFCRGRAKRFIKSKI